MEQGRFGEYGGQFVPETVMAAVSELQAAYEQYKNDPAFLQELDTLYRDYANRPSLLYYAEKMSKDLGGAKIYLKREDLNHTGAHKINNVLGAVSAGQADGKTPHHRRNRRRPARGSHRHRLCPDGDGLRGVYGQRGHPAAVLERLPDGAAGG